MTRWRQEQLRLENAYARAMLHEDGIVEVTTKRQWKNGTRQFKLPTGQMLATYKSGYVRRCDSSDRIWQLNPKYQLMASDGWYDLQLDTIRTILMFTDKHSYDVSGADIMYGNEFLKSEDND